MAGQTGGPTPDLNSDLTASLKRELLKEGHAFSFFQIIRLLRCFEHPSFVPCGTASDYSAQIRTKPNLSLAFPASDIEKVVELNDEKSSFAVIANFLGIYGTSSPLPTFYTEDLIDEESQDESVARDFIDIINQRLFSLLYKCWNKYRLNVQLLEEKSLPHLNRLFCLMGLGVEAHRQTIPEPYRLLRYMGLFMQVPRSAIGLRALLQDALSDIPVEVIPCVVRKVQIPESQLLRTGVSGNLLGVNTYLGNEIADRMGKFRIRLGPMQRADFHRLTPGQEATRWLSILTELYILEPFEYDVELIMAEKEIQTVCLGDPTRSILGIYSWIFSGTQWGEVGAIFNPKVSGDKMSAVGKQEL